VIENPLFDQYAEDYDSALDQGLSVSGENKDYFAQGRIAWLSSLLRRWRQDVRAVIDFGCGTGTSSPYFFDLLGAESVLGLDISPKSLELAKNTYGCERAHFLLFKQYQPREQIDLVFCNGVFHHIPVNERAATINYIYRSLRPGALFALWENNPWNPGTRYVMSRCPFDKDAITLTPPQARRLVRAGGFQVLRTDFLFIFPRALRWLRWLEPYVSEMAFGAQYQILCRKP
jgi:SAM-dependent methyltransferase